MHRLIFLSISIALITSEVSGYTQMLILFFVFMERWKGFGRGFALFLAYLLSIGLEFPIERIPPVYRESYLTGGPVISHYALGIGALSRPILVHILIVTLAMVTIRQVWAHARQQGWRAPWQSPTNSLGKTQPEAI